MTDWAAKVLKSVPVAYFNTRQADTPSGNLLPEQWMPAADVIAAIAKLGAGDGLVERATAALEGVTEGPWLKSEEEIHLEDGLTVARAVYPASYENARFIAFTRQWVPEAAAHIAALTAQVAELNRRAIPAADARAEALKEAEKALRDWQDSLNVHRMTETAVIVGMAADVVAALVQVTPKGSPE